MAVCIEAVHFEHADPRNPEHGSRNLAIACARRCVERVAGDAPVHLPLLVYAGIHRDDHVMEPAQAPFVQEALGAQAASDSAQRRCLSFDVDRLMAAIEVSATMMRSQGLSRAMVVAADSSFSHAHASDVVLGASAGAMILASRPNGAGFRAFRTDTFAQHQELYQTRLVWEEPGSRHGGERGGHTMVVSQQPGYLAACVDRAESSARAILDDLGVGVEALRGDVLLIASQLPPSFPTALRDRLGLPARRVVDLGAVSDGIHTAGPLGAIDQAMRDRRWDQAKHVLFVTVSPGIVVSTAWYTRPEAA